MTNLIPVTRNMQDCICDASDLGVFEGSLSQLCQHADDVVSEMETYDLIDRNCQNFCNKLLKKLGKKEFVTTKLAVCDENFDLLTKILPDVQDDKPNQKPAYMCIVSPAPTVKRFKHRKPSPKRSNQVRYSSRLSMDDHEPLVKILAPVKIHWKEIGSRLTLIEQSLRQIEHGPHSEGTSCLGRMLEKYIQTDSLASHEKLAKVVEKFDKKVAQDIIRLGESKQHISL